MNIWCLALLVKSAVIVCKTDHSDNVGQEGPTYDAPAQGRGPES